MIHMKYQVLFSLKIKKKYDTIRRLLQMPDYRMDEYLGLRSQMLDDCVPEISLIPTAPTDNIFTFCFGLKAYETKLSLQQTNYSNFVFAL